MKTGAGMRDQVPTDPDGMASECNNKKQNSSHQGKFKLREIQRKLEFARARGVLLYTKKSKRFKYQVTYHITKY